MWWMVCLSSLEIKIMWVWLSSFCVAVKTGFESVKYIKMSLFLSEKSLFADNFGNVHSKAEMHKLRSMRPTTIKFQKEIQNLC